RRGRDDRLRHVRETTRPRRDREAREAAARPCEPAPAGRAAKWSDLKYIALTLAHQAVELKRTARTKTADRNPGAVTAVADRLELTVDEIRRWVGAVTAGAGAKRASV